MFDPYHKWLGIAKEEQPPTYYRLLGVNPSEQDREVIEEAAIKQRPTSAPIKSARTPRNATGS